MPQDGTIWRAPYDTFFTRRDDGSVLIFQTNSGKTEDPRRTLEISMSMAELVDIVGFLSGAQAVTFNTENITPEEYTQALTELVPGQVIRLEPITNITADELIAPPDATLTVGLGYNPESDDPRISAGRMYRTDKDNPTEDSPSLQLSGESAIESGAGSDEPADTIAGDTGGDVT